MEIITKLVMWSGGKSVQEVMRVFSGDFFFPFSLCRNFSLDHCELFDR